MKSFLNAITLSTLLLLTSCTPPVHLYIGPPRSPHEVGKIQLASVGAEIESYKIDDVDINSIATTYLLPGSHSISVRFRAHASDADWSTIFTTPEVSSVARAQCTATFLSRPGESLFVFLSPGTWSLLGGRSTPKLAIRKEGFNMPDMVKGKCTALPNGMTF